MSVVSFWKVPDINWRHRVYGLSCWKVLRDTRRLFSVHLRGLRCGNVLRTSRCRLVHQLSPQL